MKEYMCTVCGYVHKGELPEDFVCPVCGAGTDAFREVNPEGVNKEKDSVPSSAEKPHLERELSAMEMSVICSNLARGCEKQYMPDEMEKFTQLAEFFRTKAQSSGGASFKNLEWLAERDLTENFPYALDVAKNVKDRGAQRSLVWSEKVTNMIKSLLVRYEREGESMLENTGVYVCTVCGFIYVGDVPPEICPVCKVPSWKFERQEGRAK